MSSWAMAAIPIRRVIWPRFLTDGSTARSSWHPSPAPMRIRSRATRRCETLAAAGVIVADSNAEATEAAIAALGPSLDRA